MKIQDQVVLITGSSRGLGLAIAKAFLAEGATVVLIASALKVSTQSVVWMGKEISTSKQSVQVEFLFATAREYFGKPITTIVNNYLPENFKFDGDQRKKIENLEYGDFDIHLRGYTEGVLSTTKAALPIFKDAQFGRIINIGSNLVHNPVVPYHDYTAGKAALLSFTRTLAKDLGQYGVTVNMVSGGLLNTTDSNAATPSTVFDAVASNTPLGKCATPEEVADAVLFFASPWSRGVTGQELVVDGGLVMK